MPSVLSKYISEPVHLEPSDDSAYDPPHRTSNETTVRPVSNSKTLLTNGIQRDGMKESKRVEGIFLGESDGVNSSLHSLPNAKRSDSIDGWSRTHSRNGSRSSMANGNGGVGEHESHSLEFSNASTKPNDMDQTVSSAQTKAIDGHAMRPKSPESGQLGKGSHKGHARAHSSSAPQNYSLHLTHLNDTKASPTTSDAHLSPQDAPQASKNRFSSPAVIPNTNQTLAGSPTASLHPAAPRLNHRHTLEVPRISTSRTSRDFSYPGTASEGSESGRFSPGPRTPRASNTLVRAATRSIHSDMYLDEIPPDSDMAKWTESVRQKRASRRRRKEEEDDERVIVGTKVDVNHVNWVTAYNMLTGIRFTVSRTNAKMDRELVDADFDARHKFSFDITGNELTPSAKYDFKFKDYAPWVFRHLRARFQLDPADYLMSLTSKYILSELGSPGKSGSFFYFSRDYKYIIKTIHHAEHKLLRKILRDYYTHVEHYPNTLISQFYGLHRVKIPYGRKIHFVVMNNLFPPHRDIHSTFDLKGSTIGRELKEDILERNPRATLKDLNWLRRNCHFEFGPEKKSLFIEQMRRDVALLQKLKIMDYSLLVGVHDLGRGNEENLRDKTLQVFEPGSDSSEPQINMLTRTPSKLENARQARQLRQIIKKEKPVPIDKSTNKMPDEMLEERKNFIFYSDDGGFRATHENGEPGEEIYYLGIIDCLTHYGFVKRAEHFWKGMSNNKSQISPIPPEGYGDRFINFIKGITMTKEEQERAGESGEQMDGSIETPRQSSLPVPRKSFDNKVIDKAEKQAQKTEREGASETPQQERTLSSMRSPSADRSGGTAGTTLPVVEEDREASSREDSVQDEKRGSAVSEGVAQNEQRPGPLPNYPKDPDRMLQPKEQVPSNTQLPSIPNFNRLSMGLQSNSKNDPDT
ncbi:Phosphatidylinositol-4-phosphate 5-kinase [Lecanora helva]